MANMDIAVGVTVLGVLTMWTGVRRTGVRTQRLEAKRGVILVKRMMVVISIRLASIGKEARKEKAKARAKVRRKARKAKGRRKERTKERV